MTFFEIRTNIVVQACGGQLPRFSTCSRNFIIDPLVSFEKSPSHPKPVAALSSPNLLLSTSTALPPNFSAPHSSTACPSDSVLHCQCFAHSFLCSSHLFESLTSLSSSSKTCTPSLQAVGFVILCNTPAPPSALAIIRLTSFWC